MAEIRVRPKPRSLVWLWVLLVLVVLALVAWYLVSSGIIHVNTAAAPATPATSALTRSSLSWS